MWRKDKLKHFSFHLHILIEGYDRQVLFVILPCILLYYNILHVYRSSITIMRKI